MLFLNYCIVGKTWSCSADDEHGTSLTSSRARVHGPPRRASLYLYRMRWTSHISEDGVLFRSTWVAGCGVEVFHVMLCRGLHITALKYVAAQHTVLTGRYVTAATGR